jgi:hypothetical protein
MESNSRYVVLLSLSETFNFIRTWVVVTLRPAHRGTVVSKVQPLEDILIQTLPCDSD